MNFSEESQVIILVLIAIISNWPSIFGLSVHIDSWIVCRWLHDNDLEEIRKFYKNVGIPLMAPIIISLWRFSRKNLQLSGIIVFHLRIGHALAIFVVLKDILNYGSEFAFIITLLTIIYPSQTYVNDFVVGLLYGISWPLFTIGSTVYLSSHIITDENWIRIFLVCISAILIIISFNMKSILVIALIFNSTILITSIAVWPENTSIDLSLKILMTALPIIYWITIEKLYPRSNEYENYNKFIRFNKIFNCAINLIQGVSGALFGAILQASKLFKHPELCLCLATIYFTTKNNFSNKSLDLSQIDPSFLFLSGLVICFISLVPYAIVGQNFDHIGYLTKNLILCDISWAIVVSSLFLISFMGKIPLNFFISFVIVIMIYNCLNQFKLWVFYAKQCEIRNFISEIDTEVDVALIIEDLSSWTNYGKKSKFYPMTINFMDKKQSKPILKCFSPSKSKDLHEILNTAVHHYYNEALPTLKKNYNPQQVIKLVVQDDIITMKNLYNFIVAQFRKDPFDIQSSSRMFKVKAINL